MAQPNGKDWKTKERKTERKRNETWQRQKAVRDKRGKRIGTRENNKEHPTVNSGSSTAGWTRGMRRRKRARGQITVGCSTAISSSFPVWVPLCHREGKRHVVLKKADAWNVYSRRTIHLERVRQYTREERDLRRRGEYHSRSESRAEGPAVKVSQRDQWEKENEWRTRATVAQE